jgi:hypothetical protein
MGASTLSKIRWKLSNHGVAATIEKAPSYARRELLVDVVAGQLSREGLRQYAADEGRIWDVGTAERVTVDHPDRESLPDRLRRACRTVDLDQPFVCELPDARLLGHPHPLALTRDGRILREVAKDMFVHDRMRELLAERGTLGALSALLGLGEGDGDGGAGARAHARYDRAFPLIRTEGASSYGHWLTEDLPTLRCYHRYRELTGETPTVLIEPDPPGWVTDWVELLGVDDYEPWTAASATVDRLVVPTIRPKVPRGSLTVYQPSTAEYEWVRDRARAAVGDDAGTDEFPPAVFVSRELAGTRRVRNRDALLAAIEPFGVEPYRLEELSVAEQVRLFAAAETVVAPHGSGLANLVLADDAHVVELLPESTQPPAFFCLARELGFEYDWVECEQVGDAEWAIQRDLVVDVDAVRSMLADRDGTERD